jgi:flagellar protein FliS
MTAYASTSHASYRESAILTAPPEQLVIMLYDGVHRFLLQSAAAMRDGRCAEAGERLGRATAIIDELQCTLDLDAGEVAQRLSGIYVFCRRHLAEGLCERDPEKLDRVAALLRELREAFAHAAAVAPSASAAA